MAIRQAIAPYQKALVPVVLGAVLYVLRGIGINPDMSIAEAVQWIVAAFLVWLIPNQAE